MNTKPEQATEFDNFDRTMRRLVSVPHSEIKAKLDAEKLAKQKGKSRDSRDKDDNRT